MALNPMNPFSLSPDSANMQSYIEELKKKDLGQMSSLEQPKADYGVPEAQAAAATPSAQTPGLQGSVAQAGIQGVATLAKAMMDAKAIREKAKREQGEKTATKVADAQQDMLTQQMNSTSRPLQQLIEAYRSVI